MRDRRLVAEIAKIEAEISLKNLRLQERTANLVSKGAVLREVAELVARVKGRILAAPDEFEPRFPAEVRAECKVDFEDFARQLLREISQWQVLGMTTDDAIIYAADAIKANQSYPTI